MIVAEKMNSMACRILRRHGFYREKGKAIFTRHTVGVGGIWVEILPEGARVTVRDTQPLKSMFNSVSKLEKMIERLNVIDQTESFRWKEQVSQVIERGIGS